LSRIVNSQRILSMNCRNHHVPKRSVHHFLTSYCVDYISESLVGSGGDWAWLPILRMNGTNFHQILFSRQYQLVLRRFGEFVSQKDSLRPFCIRCQTSDHVPEGVHILMLIFTRVRISERVLYVSCTYPPSMFF